jgi:hypothetical protein
MADSIDMIMPMLREMRAENAVRFDFLEPRLAKIEGQMTSFKHARTSDTLMTRLLTGKFEERIEALEAKVRESETHK